MTTIYDKYADEAVNAFLKEKIPLTTTITKIATREHLNPEQLKRVIESANNSTYLALYPHAKDKYVEFPVASSEKVATTTLQPQLDDYEDYKQSPLSELPATLPIPIKHTNVNINYPNINDLSTNEVLKVSHKIYDTDNHFINYFQEQELLFKKTSEQLFKEVKQEILQHTSFNLIKQAMLLSQTTDEAIEVVTRLFEDYKDRLEKLGADKYPYYADLNDTSESTTPTDENHPLVKTAQKLNVIINNYKTSLEKVSSFRSHLFSALGGAAGSAALLALLFSIKKQRNQMLQDLSESPLNRTNIPENMGFRTATWKG